MLQNISIVPTKFYNFTYFGNSVYNWISVLNVDNHNGLSQYLRIMGGLLFNTFIYNISFQTNVKSSTASFHGFKSCDYLTSHLISLLDILMKPDDIRLFIYLKQQSYDPGTVRKWTLLIRFHKINPILQWTKTLQFIFEKWKMCELKLYYFCSLNHVPQLTKH